METTNLLHCGVEILSACEESLHELLEQAVAARDYEAVLELTSMARAVADIAASGKASQPSAVVTGEPVGSTSARPVSRKKSADYPRFLRRGEDLIKIGWSKKEKKEYQHKTPRKAVDVLVAMLMKVGDGGKVFSTEKILPATEPTDGTPVPEYQVYVALAWLRHIGLIDQHGRQGYSIQNVVTLNRAVETAWEQLTEL